MQVTYEARTPTGYVLMTFDSLEGARAWIEARALHDTRIELWHVTRVATEEKI